MKRIFYSLAVLLLFGLALQAQNDNLAKGPDIIIRGPIIDNINANTGTLSAIKRFVGSVDNIDYYDGVDDTSIEGEQALAPNETSNAQDNVWSKESAGVDAETVSQIDRDMRFYPNPAISALNVELGGRYQVSIGLVNMLGQEVLRQEGEMDQLRLDVSNLQPGFYLLHVRIGQESIVKRIEIAR